MNYIILSYLILFVDMLECLIRQTILTPKTIPRKNKQLYGRGSPCRRKGEFQDVSLSYGMVPTIPYRTSISRCFLFSNRMYVYVGTYVAPLDI